MKYFLTFSFSLAIAGATSLFWTPPTQAAYCVGDFCLSVTASCGVHEASWGYSLNRAAHESCAAAGERIKCTYTTSMGNGYGPGKYTYVPAGNHWAEVTCSCAGVSGTDRAGCTVEHAMFSRIEGPNSFDISSDAAQWVLHGGYSNDDPLGGSESFRYNIQGAELFSGKIGIAKGSDAITFGAGSVCNYPNDCQYRGPECCANSNRCLDAPFCDDQGGSLHCYNYNAATWDEVSGCPFTCGTYTISGGVMSEDGISSSSAEKTITVNCPGGGDDPVAASGSISGSACAIPEGGSSCTANFSWYILNAGNPNVYNETLGETFSSGDESGNGAYSLQGDESYTLQARNGNALLDETILEANCATGTSWNGSVCETGGTPTPGLTIKYYDSNSECGGSEFPGSRTLEKGSSVNIVACDQVNEDKTISATWTEESGNSAVSLSGTSPKSVSADEVGVEEISASYNGALDNANVTVFEDNSNDGDGGNGDPGQWKEVTP